MRDNQDYKEIDSLNLQISKSGTELRVSKSSIRAKGFQAFGLSTRNSFSLEAGFRV